MVAPSAEEGKHISLSMEDRQRIDRVIETLMRVSGRPNTSEWGIRSQRGWSKGVESSTEQDILTREAAVEELRQTVSGYNHQGSAEIEAIVKIAEGLELLKNKHNASPALLPLMIAALETAINDLRGQNPNKSKPLSLTTPSTLTENMNTSVHQANDTGQGSIREPRPRIPNRVLEMKEEALKAIKDAKDLNKRVYHDMSTWDRIIKRKLGDPDVLAAMNDYQVQEYERQLRRLHHKMIDTSTADEVAFQHALNTKPPTEPIQKQEYDL